MTKNLDESIGLSDGTVSKTYSVSKNLDESIAVSDGTVSKTYSVTKNLDESIASVMELYQRLTL